MALLDAFCYIGLGLELCAVYTVCPRSSMDRTLDF